MNLPSLSDDLRRLIHSIQSISHLEAILLLRQDSSYEWQAPNLASRLYVSINTAGTILMDLEAIGIAKRNNNKTNTNTNTFVFSPANQDLADLVDQLASYYAHHLIEVTNMVHSRANQTTRVQQFADAFKFQKKDE